MSSRPRLSLPAVHSVMAGYADTGGFLALKGLFTSHVTGNFVTLGSALVFGSSGTLAKVLALPTFCLTVVLIRLMSLRLRAAGWPVLRSLLTLQNAAHRAHLSHTPPSTVMTVTTTQIMLDLGDMLHGLPPDKAATIRTRLKVMTASVVLFAAGCALAALLFAQFNQWCFCVPPLLGACTLMLRQDEVNART